MNWRKFDRIYVYGWFNTAAESNAQNIRKFIQQSESLFELVGSIPGIEIYQYRGKGAGENIHCFEINAHGDVKVYGKLQ